MTPEQIQKIFEKHPKARKVCVYVDTSGSSFDKPDQILEYLEPIIQATIENRRSLRLCGFNHCLYWSRNYIAPHRADTLKRIRQAIINHLIVPGGTDFYTVYRDIERQSKRDSIVAMIASDMDVDLSYPSVDHGDVLRQMSLDDSIIYYDATCYKDTNPQCVKHFAKEYTELRSVLPQIITDKTSLCTAVKPTKRRGCLTPEIKKKYGVSIKQLRLLPYLQDCLMNSRPIDPNKIDAEERKILQEWRDQGHITFSMSETCTCTKKFWDIMSEILYDAYVPEKE